MARRFGFGLSEGFAKNESIIGYVLAVFVIVLLLWIIGHQVKENMLMDDSMLHLLKDILTPLDPIVKTLKLYKGDKSYTINKDKIFLCLYDEHGQYYPLNHLVYVLIHELSHRLNDFDVGHTETFYRIFDDLLDRAHKLGIYNPKIPIVTNYCGSH